MIKSPQTCNYFKGKLPAGTTLMVLQSMEEFSRFVTVNHIHNIFLLQVEETGQQYFTSLQHGVLIAHPSLGFNTMDDYFESSKKAFPNAELFYAAKAEGYGNYKDYQLVKEAGITDTETFDKIKTGGFIAGFAEWQEWKNTQQILPEWERITNPYTLYQYASAGAFTNYQHLKKAVELGFTDANYYADAINRGFNNAAEYEEGLRKGFPDAASFSYAKANQIRDVFDYSNYLAFSNSALENTTHDQQVLLSVISKLPQEKKVSVNKLYELLKAAVTTHAYDDTKELPGWFKQALHSTTDISSFLQSTDAAMPFGTYDSEGEYFETRQLNQRKVVLDGANVAHGIVGDAKCKPLVENILKVVKKLQGKGFTEITVISDASLKYRLADKERLPELESCCEYFSAPAETTADVFLIDFVKENRCLLVTNDTFREWKLKDKWVAENIDYYKLSFMIDGDKVLMPDVDLVNK